jgi:hypothetical protein
MTNEMAAPQRTLSPDYIHLGVPMRSLRSYAALALIRIRSSERWGSIRASSTTGRVSSRSPPQAGYTPCA